MAALRRLPVRQQARILPIRSSAVARQGVGELDAVRMRTGPGKPPRSRGMGHVRVACNSCHDQLRQTVFFEPAHDRRRRRLTVWVTGPHPRR